MSPDSAHVCLPLYHRRVTRGLTAANALLAGLGIALALFGFLIRRTLKKRPAPDVDASLSVVLSPPVDDLYDRKLRKRQSSPVELQRIDNGRGARRRGGSRRNESSGSEEDKHDTEDRSRSVAGKDV